MIGHYCFGTPSGDAMDNGPGAVRVSEARQTRERDSARLLRCACNDRAAMLFIVSWMEAAA
jgi:hypothetical protein